MLGFKNWLSARKESDKSNSYGIFYVAHNSTEQKALTNLQEVLDTHKVYTDLVAKMKPAYIIDKARTEAELTEFVAENNAEKIKLTAELKTIKAKVAQEYERERENYISKLNDLKLEVRKEQLKLGELERVVGKITELEQKNAKLKAENQIDAIRVAEVEAKIQAGAAIFEAKDNEIQDLKNILDVLMSKDNSKITLLSPERNIGVVNEKQVA